MDPTDALIANVNRELSREGLFRELRTEDPGQATTLPCRRAEKMTG